MNRPAMSGRVKRSHWISLVEALVQHVPEKGCWDARYLLQSQGEGGGGIGHAMTSLGVWLTLEGTKPARPDIPAKL